MNKNNEKVVTLCSQYFQSGKFFLKAGEYDRALNHFLRVKSADDENIALAIQTVGEAKDEKLSRTLLDFLLGQHDDGQVICPFNFVPDVLPS